MTARTLCYSLILFFPLCISAQTPSAVGGGGVDLDGDGMSDLWEAYYNARGVAPTADTDGDGKTNLYESRTGTDPRNPASFFEILPLLVNPSRNELTVNFQSLRGKSYQLMGSSNLRSWIPVGIASDGLNGPDSTILSFGSSLPDSYFVRANVSDRDSDLDGLTAFEEGLVGYTDSNRNSNGLTTRNDFASAVEMLSNGQSFTLNSRVVPGQLPTMEESARFLIQAGMGADYELIQQVSQTGFSAWIESEFNRSPVYHEPRVLSFLRTEQSMAGVTISISSFMFSWWDINMRGNDMLRQRVAYALSQILVVSTTGSDALEDNPWGMANYYDILVRHAFGNYRDILYEVTYHPVMGLYLSHAKNRRGDPATNRFPDENYAREIMQLFSIGLYELNQDGTRKQDANGNYIPTYTNADIREFAKIFTGLTYNGTHVPGVPNGLNPGDDGTARSESEFLDADTYFNNPMQVYEPAHEPGPKQLLSYTAMDGSVVSGAIPAGQTTDADIRAAIDNIFNHPNVAPFIGKLLIQRMVKSNPSPAYINRVALAFNNNGSGIRGDMRSVIRAILLDPEARNRGYLNDPTNGRLREPYMRYLHLCRAFNLTTTNGTYQNRAPDARLAFQQQPLTAPSVFNFYLPNHSPLGPINDAGLVAPEFEITTASTTVSTMNFWVRAAFYQNPMEFDGAIGQVGATMDLQTEYALAATNPAALVDRLDIILTYGSMDARSKRVILNAITQAAAAGMSVNDRVHLAIYLFVNTPDFAVLR
ncbi:MAG: DUF1800 family protein [Verrucomicrobiota bacterium]